MTATGILSVPVFPLRTLRHYRPRRGTTGASHCSTTWPTGWGTTAGDDGLGRVRTPDRSVRGDRAHRRGGGGAAPPGRLRRAVGGEREDRAGRTDPWSWSTRWTDRRTPAVACRGTPPPCASSTTTARPSALVANQATGDRFTAVRGEGAWRGGGRACGRPTCTAAARPIVGISGLPRGSTGGRSSGRLGAAALDLCLVAAGTLDAYVDMSPDAHGVWDYLAGAADLPRAGAVVVDAADRELTVVEHGARRTPVAAATPELHRDAPRRASPGRGHLPGTLARSHGAHSSAGQSTSLTRQVSGVRVPLRPRSPAFAGALRDAAASGGR